MEALINIDSIYVPSEDIVFREIEGEVIIVPLVSGIGDMEDDLFTLNATARAVWEKLNGKRRLKDVVRELASEYEASSGEIETDVIGLLSELLKRKMIIQAPTDLAPNDFLIP